MQYQHQSTPVGLPSTDKVCSALRYRNIDPLGSPTWIHWRLSRWGVVSATDTWCMLVGSCLQCRGASLVCHRQPLVTNLLTLLTYLRHRRLSLAMLHAWTLEYQHITWCSASDGGYLRRQKDQLEKTAGSPSQRLAQQDPGGCQRSTAIYAVEIWDRHGS